MTLDQALPKVHPFRLHRHHNTGTPFTKQGSIEAHRLILDGQFHTQTGRDAALGERHGQSAVAAVVRRSQHSGVDPLAQQALNSSFEIKIHQWGTPGQTAGDQLLVAAACHPQPWISLIIKRHSEQDNGISGLTPAKPDNPGDVLHQTHHADHGRGVNGLNRSIVRSGLVVQRDIAAGHRGFQHATGLGDTATGHRKLPVTPPRLRRRKIQIVRDRQRLGTHATEIAGGLGHCGHGASLGIESNPAVRAVDRGRHATDLILHGVLGTQADNSCVPSTGRHHRVGQNLLVVLAIDPAFAGNGGVVQQAHQQI